MSGNALGVDVGGTASRWVLVDRTGAVLARGTAPGANGHVFNPAERERLGAVLREIGAALAPQMMPEAAWLGITGFGEPVGEVVQSLVAEHLGVGGGSVRLSDDMELTYRSAFAPGEGHLVSAGTGSIGLHLAEDGTITRVGGRGLLIDDGGSGTWIALRALDRLYRRIDEAGTPEGAEILAEELFALVGGADWDATRAFVYGSDRGRIGTLAQGVARAAQRGDATAGGVLRDAGRELARLARALVARLGARPIGFVGGVIALSPLIRAGIEAELMGHELRFLNPDPALYAAQRARDLLQGQDS